MTDNHGMAAVDPIPVVVEEKIPQRLVAVCEVLRNQNLQRAQREKDGVIDFVKRHIRRKECVRFVDADSEGDIGQIPEGARCHCGATFDQHPTDIDNSESISGFRKWTDEEDIKTFPTNAFGMIDFLGGGDSVHKVKYLRLADDTDPRVTLALMTRHWSMAEPEMVISFIGGTETCCVRDEKKAMLAGALDEISRRFDTWVFAHGCNEGASQIVTGLVTLSECMRADTSLHLIGVAPWGHIDKHEDLVEKAEAGCWEANYESSHLQKSLNVNHTHLLFVDDGHRNRYGKMADFRATLENEISVSFPAKPTVVPVSTEASRTRAVVTVLVQGGTDAIVHVKRSLEQKIPVLVCEGTGRAADVLAYAARHYVGKQGGKRSISRRHMSTLRCKALATYGRTWRGKMGDEHQLADDILKLVLQCCYYDDLLMIHNMDSPKVDLPLAVYMLAYKVTADTKIQKLIVEKLHLAAVGDNIATAKEIFSQEIRWEEGCLDEVMYIGLTQEKVGVVSLCLDNGFDMRKYLNVGRLWDLYDGMPNLLHYRQAPRDLNEVCQLVSKLMYNKYAERYYKNFFRDDAALFEQPYRELFLWSVLTDRQSLQNCIWERSEDRIALAIAGSHIYGSMARQLGESYANRNKAFTQKQREFEVQAMRIVNGVHGWQASCDLIEKRHVIWGGKDSLDMAAAAECKEFLCTVPCQLSLNSRWRREIKCKPYMIYLAIICPLVIIFGSCFANMRRRRSWLAAIGIFYSAPVTKFVMNMCMYLAFLLLYSYVILFDFRPTMRWTESVMIGWMLTMLLEEIREMLFASNAETVSGRLYDWWYSAINRMDLVIFVLAGTAFILRCYGDYDDEVKTMYCVNCILLYARMLRFFSASNHLGPKLIMIREMVKELLFYLVIMVVFFVAHGVVIMAVTQPTRDFKFEVIREIFYYPYWQMFGELSLDILQGATDDCINSTTRNNGQPCAQFSVLVPMFTAGYLMLTSVLLLNLLIAIFNHVFESVERETIENYRFGMYFLLLEYHEKPVLPPPFIVIEHAFLVVRFLCCSVCCRKTALADHMQPLERHSRVEMVGMSSRRDKLREEAAVRRTALKTAAENQELMTQASIEDLKRRHEQMSERQESISERQEEIATRHHDMLLVLQRQLDRLAARHVRGTSMTGSVDAARRHTPPDSPEPTNQLLEAVDRMRRIETENRRLLARIDEIHAANRNIEQLVNTIRRRQEDVLE